MQPPKSAPPVWLPWLSRLVLRLGVGRSTAFLTLLAWAGAVAVSQLAITLIGQGDRWLAALFSSICCLVITPLLGFACMSLVRHLDTEHGHMRRLATRDGLTGVYNRRHFLDLLEREWSRAQRYDTAAAMLLLDVDHFKNINDQFGHLCGDAMLKAVAEALMEILRQPDVLARFGGEEFIVFLPQTDPLGAIDVAERMRDCIERLSLDWEGQSVSVTISVGVAAMRPEHVTVDHLIHDADVALYAAKAAGRNCVRAGDGLFAGKPSYQRT
ncbi:MAG: GGDEF domain-containing protein [Burkholderiaceae bacterium]|nr:GGDEF domain-containing protein [Burkholderiaceae bacterium]